MFDDGNKMGLGGTSCYSAELEGARRELMKVERDAGEGGVGGGLLRSGWRGGRGCCCIIVTGLMKVVGSLRVKVTFPEDGERSGAGV